MRLTFNTKTSELEITSGDHTLVINNFFKESQSKYIRETSLKEQLDLIKKLGNSLYSEKYGGQ